MELECSCQKGFLLEIAKQAMYSAAGGKQQTCVIQLSLGNQCFSLGQGVWRGHVGCTANPTSWPVQIRSLDFLFVFCPVPSFSKVMLNVSL
jgi:hypothetical protein